MTRPKSPDQAPPAPTPLTTATPWLLVGVSRCTWYRLWSKGLAPAPVAIPGFGRNVWRTADVLAFLQNLPTLDQPRPATPGCGRPRKQAAG